MSLLDVSTILEEVDSVVARRDELAEQLDDAIYQLTNARKKLKGLVADAADGTKVCSRCGATKPVSDFYFRNSAGREGDRLTWCRGCFNERKQERLREKKAAEHEEPAPAARSPEIGDQKPSKEFVEPTTSVEPAPPAPAAEPSGEVAETKTCSDCGQTKPVGEYYRINGYLLKRCKPCQRQLTAETKRSKADTSASATEDSHDQLVREGYRIPKQAVAQRERRQREAEDAAAARLNKSSYCLECGKRVARGHDYCSDTCRDRKPVSYKDRLAAAKEQSPALYGSYPTDGVPKVPRFPADGTAS